MGTERLSEDFWRGRRVFLTGHSGFKGGWLSLWLQQMGAELTGFSLEPPTDPSLFELASVKDGMNSLIGDIRDLSLLTSAIQRAQPEIVFHLAAQPLVQYSYEEPVETYTTNVIGTVNLLESVRVTPSVQAVVVVTSDKCYENREQVWGYRETDPVGGYDPYSSSKGCTELVTSAYRRSFFSVVPDNKRRVALASARAGNVIGGGDWASNRLLPDIIRACANAETLHIRYPDAIRPWQHVLEPLSGYLMLAERLVVVGERFAESWNFGPHDDDARPVSWIADRVVRSWGGLTRWVLDEGQHAHEAHYLKLDCSKARAELGWKPRWGLDLALEKTIEWHKAYHAGKAMRQVSLNQIKAFSVVNQ